MHRPHLTNWIWQSYNEAGDWCRKITVLYLSIFHSADLQFAFFFFFLNFVQFLCAKHCADFSRKLFCVSPGGRSVLVLMRAKFSGWPTCKAREGCRVGIGRRQGHTSAPLPDGPGGPSWRMRRDENPLGPRRCGVGRRSGGAFSSAMQQRQQDTPLVSCTLRWLLCFSFSLTHSNKSTWKNPGNTQLYILYIVYDDKCWNTKAVVHLCLRLHSHCTSSQGLKNNSCWDLCNVKEKCKCI